MLHLGSWFQALLWAAIINGRAAPPLLILITMIANNRKIMGVHTNGHFCNALCCLAIGAVLAASAGMLITFSLDR